jgi:hypothetical protein
MTPLPPVDVEMNRQESSFFFRPGDFNQDKYTIPAEILVVTLLSQANPPTKPRWPFQNERTTESRIPSRQPGYFAAGLTAGIAAPLVASLYDANPDFPGFTHLRGLVHSHLITESLTMGAKVWFGRRRPFYDTEEPAGRVTKEERFSFFSGHASHTFAFAAYGSGLALSELKDSPSAWMYTGLLFGSATWIAASRAIDKQHNWSDVIVGATVGSAVGYWTFNRVSQVSEYQVQVEVSFNSVTILKQLK